jgi:hypothetical protein
VRGMEPENTGRKTMRKKTKKGRWANHGDSAPMEPACQVEISKEATNRDLRGEQIPLGARIISIAIALDAMLSDWPYRNALTMSNAREEIGRCAGTQFDPKIVEVFLTIPESHWIELRENLSSPFRLTHSRNMGFVPQ